MVSSEEGSLDSIKLCLEGTKTNLIQWGHEYLRSLAGEIGSEFEKRIEGGLSNDDLFQLVDIVIPYFMKHNEEPEAVDLLMEVEKLDMLLKFTSETNYERVCNYLLSCSYYAADPQEMNQAFKTCFEIYIQQKKYP
jgi:26S proteasome regulatory subunit N1